MALLRGLGICGLLRSKLILLRKQRLECGMVWLHQHHCVDTETPRDLLCHVGHISHTLSIYNVCSGRFTSSKLTGSSQRSIIYYDLDRFHMRHHDYVSLEQLILLLTPPRPKASHPIQRLASRLHPAWNSSTFC